MKSNQSTGKLYNGYLESHGCLTPLEAPWSPKRVGGGERGAALTDLEKQLVELHNLGLEDIRRSLPRQRRRFHCRCSCAVIAAPWLLRAGLVGKCSGFSSGYPRFGSAHCNFRLSSCCLAAGRGVMRLFGEERVSSCEASRGSGRGREVAGWRLAMLFEWVIGK